MTKVLTIASGKGGAGKTSISLNLALALARAKQRVCLFDADLGLANVNILTGLYPQYGLAQVMEGSHTLSDIMIRNYNGIDIIPGSSGVEKLADLSPHEAGRLIRSFLGLPDYDYFLVDTSAGISCQVLSFCRAAQEMILVVTPEPTSLTDAYALIKVLSKKGTMPKIRVVVNRVTTAQQARAAYAKFKKTVFNFLSVRITPLGIVAHDPNVSGAVIRQEPFLLKTPDTPAARCIQSLVGKLLKAPGKEICLGGFWDQCLELLGNTSGRRDNIATPLTQNHEGVKDPAAPAQQNNAETIGRLAGIEEKLTLLLQEVTDLKQSLQTAPPKSPATQPRDRKTPAPRNRPTSDPEGPEHFILDFETWLAEQGKSQANGFSTA